MPQVESWVALAWVIGGGVLFIAAVVAGFFSGSITGWIRKQQHARHHHAAHRRHHHGHVAGVKVAAQDTLEKLADFKDSPRARENVFSAELTLAMYCLTLLFAALCYLGGFTALSDFGLASAVTENVYAFFGIALVFFAGYATFSALDCAGGAFVVCGSASFFTGVALFLLACTPSGNYGIWTGAIAMIGAGVTVNTAIFAMASRTQLGVWHMASIAWFMIYVLISMLFVFLTFSVNVLAPGGSYYIVAPIVHLAFALVAIPLLFVTASTNVPKETQGYEELNARIRA